jgi:hypothetical protein
MRKFTCAVAGAAVALSALNAASASERHDRHRHLQQHGVSVHTGPREAYDYYPGWGRDSVRLNGVYPGLMYGGATSAPAGH